VPEPTQSRMRERLMGELCSLRERSQFRALDSLSGIDLCSNDYLGLAADPRIKQAVIEAVARTASVGSTGSRLLSGNSKQWEDLESEFATFAGTEAALYFGSGYAANIGLLSSVLKPRDIVYSDALNHASLIDGIRLSGAMKIIYPHGDLEYLEQSLREHAGHAGAQVIVTESLFSMEGDIAPIAGLIRLAKDHDTELVIDEAHAIGVFGPQGRGIVVEHGCEREIFATIHTCGKALASAGAFVCGGKTLKDYLVNRARTFIFSTAMPPYLAHQIRAALALVREADDRRAHLHKIASSLRAALAAGGLGFGASTTHIVPILLGTNEMALHVAAQLQVSGFAVKAIRPPTVPPCTSRIRLALNSKINAEDIRRLVAEIGIACKSWPQFSASSAVHA
jgi:8-amino-7-oxononanoate synthase